MRACVRAHVRACVSSGGRRLKLKGTEWGSGWYGEISGPSSWTEGVGEGWGRRSCLCRTVGFRTADKPLSTPFPTPSARSQAALPL